MASIPLVPTPISPALPSFFTELGWDQHLKTLNAPIETLLGFLSLSLSNQYVEGSPSHLFEEGIAFIVEFFKNYLSHADQAVSSFHGRLRETITQDTKAKFRRLKPQTFVAYGLTAARVIIFVLRVKRTLKRRSKQKQKQKAENARLTLDQLLLTSTQIILFERLYKKIMKQNDDSDQAAMPEIIHKILVSLLTTVLDASKPVGSVVEQVLAIEMHSVKNHGTTIRSANFLTGECARLHRLWLTVLVHSALLGNFKKPYSLPVEDEQEVHNDFDNEEDSCFIQSSGEDAITNPVLDLPDDLDDSLELEIESQERCLDMTKEDDNSNDDLEADFSEDNESDQIGDNEPDGDDGSAELAQARSIESENNKGAQMTKFIEENFKWVEPISHKELTLASRIKFIWKIAHPIAAKEGGKFHVNWCDNGAAMRITRTNGNDLKLDIAILRAAAQNSLEAVDSAIQNAIGSSVSYSDFKIAAIQDDFASEKSLFDRSDNQAVFKPFVEQIWFALTARSSKQSLDPTFVDRLTGRWCDKNVDDALNRFQNLLDSLLLAISITCGVPPRGWQTLHILFRQYGTFRRNVRIYRQSHILLTNPRAKQRDSSEFAAFWSLTQRLGTALIFYLGVIRPIVIDIFRRRSISVDDQMTHVFARSTKRTKMFTSEPFSYTTADLNHMLMKSPLQAENRTLRHINIAILREHFPEVMTFAQNGDSAGDRQSQHQGSTARVHYARDEAIQGVGASMNDIQQQVNVSHKIQAFLGLLPLASCAGLNQVIGNVNELHSQALACARILVVEKHPGYCIGQVDIAQRQKMIQDLCDRLPFVLSPNNSAGDEVLVQVTASLVYGQNTTLPLQYCPPEGYEARLPATATVLIMLALEEWATGCFTSFSSWQNVSQKVEQRINEAEDQVKHLKNADFEAWMKFCARVRHCGLSGERSTCFRETSILSRDLTNI
ncbi:hypothetical protein J132_10941 [Termitomyces sp. J132]|nr:hypothetical protein J132_10941 [Termitomyces sp. J132]